MHYQKEVNEIIKELNSNSQGLTDQEVNSRLKTYGKNEIKKLKNISIIKLILLQFKNFVIYILLGALLISIFTNEFTDAIVIAIILILNASLGFYQEFKAEKAIEALKKLSSPKALVIRNNKLTNIDSANVVPGDILSIEEGAYIPADARLIEVSDLKVDESTLTGESTTVSKIIEAIKSSKQLADQRNMVFAGTMAARGRGKAIVVFTGFNTELGKIAKEIQIPNDKSTPLQKKLNKLGKYLSFVVLAIAFLILLLDIFRSHMNFFESLKLGIAVAVAVIPEGLPAVVTITLALGTQKMLKNNALIRKLSAVETLGSTTIICSDKTGTLTKNEMTVTEVFYNNKIINITGKGYDTKGDFTHNNKKINQKELNKLFEILKLCNNASLNDPSDPTEKALLVLSEKAKFNISHERLEEIPFSSESKFMTTIDKINNKKIYHMKGAPEVVLKMSKFIEINGKKILMTKQDKQNLIEQQNRMASNALRVLGAAYSENSKDFIFVGLVGMIDPPRDEIKESIQICKQAGIKIIMITGDHDLTAKAIAKEIGIGENSLTGKDLEELNLDDLKKIAEKVDIFSRVDPRHKVKILEALKSKGHIVAMTGDGVNDALALKKAEIGIAVGSGTDVAKGASDMVLTDDNFASIVKAVKEGRGVYNNIKKFILFLFSSNLAEILIILTSLIANLPLPIIAIQLLWINILTDGLPALALGIDPVDKNIMKFPPRKSNERIINNKDAVKLLMQGIIMSVSTLSVFFIFLKSTNLIYAQTMAFTTLVILELFNSLNYRSDRNSIFSKELFSNKYLLLAISASFILQLVIIYLLPNLFKATPLIFIDWAWILIAALPVLIIQEIVKLTYPKLFI